MPSPPEFLIFRLWGPMMSWGSIAVGEQRQSWTRPSRSAVLGLVAAALGFERANASAHQSLEVGLGFAVREDDPGRALRDYHTTQSPQSENRRRWRSRHDEIHGSKKLNTILSERTYYTEMSAVVALWSRDLAAASHVPTMPSLAEKLRRPVFTLYLGRKASPLGRPIAPLVVPNASLREALAAFDADEVATLARAQQTSKPYSLLPDLKSPHQPTREQFVWLDVRDHVAVGAHTVRQRTSRRDGIRDRKTWTFDERAEVQVTLQEAP